MRRFACTSNTGPRHVMNDSARTTCGSFLAGVTPRPGAPYCESCLDRVTLTHHQILKRELAIGVSFDPGLARALDRAQEVRHEGTCACGSDVAVREFVSGVFTLASRLRDLVWPRLLWPQDGMRPEDDQVAQGRGPSDVALWNEGLASLPGQNGHGASRG